MTNATLDAPAVTGAASPYARAVDAWREAGWLGVLRLPPRAKKWPPTGFTGHSGKWPTDSDVEAWRAEPEANVCLRVPADVIGLDADTYKDAGATSWRELERECGPLPPTWRITNRADETSGTYLFRLPCEIALIDGLPGIDLIQNHHRYQLLPPSIHPDGRVYRMYDPEGAEPNVPPSRDDLPLLPDAWLDRLRKADTVPVGVSAEARPARARPTGEWASCVKNAYADACAAMASGFARHDAARNGACALVRLESLGWPGAADALDLLGADFMARIASDRATPEQARKEWRDIVSSAEREVASTPPTAPRYVPPVTDMDGMVDRSAATSAESAERTPAESVERVTSWMPEDLGPVLRGEVTDKLPEIFIRTDGVALVYAGKQHSFSGEPESCKGWAVCYASAQAILSGKHVGYYDFEDGAAGIVDRHRSLRVPDDLIAERLHYVRPTEPLSHDPRADLAPVLAFRPDLAVIDGVTEAMALHGFDLASNVDSARFQALLPRPLAEDGCAVILVDHVTKSAEGNRRYAIGAQHKLAGLDGAAYGFHVVQPFGRGREGHVRIDVTKDRPGYVRGHAVGKGRIAEMHLYSDPDGGVHIDLRPPSDPSTFRPTFLMEQLSRHIETYEGQSQRDILKAVKGDDKAKVKALGLLITEGFVEVAKNGRAHLHSVIRPFRNEDGALPDVA